MAGPPALHGSESGQVRKEAAKAILCKCRGPGSPPFSFAILWRYRVAKSKIEAIVTKSKFVIAAVMFAASPAAYAVDGLSFEYGRSDSSNAKVNLYRVNAQ